MSPVIIDRNYGSGRSHDYCDVDSSASFAKTRRSKLEVGIVLRLPTEVDRLKLDELIEESGEGPDVGLQPWVRDTGPGEERAISVLDTRDGEYDRGRTEVKPLRTACLEPRQQWDGADCDRSRSAGVVERDTVTTWRDDATG